MLVAVISCAEGTGFRGEYAFTLVHRPSPLQDFKTGFSKRFLLVAVPASGFGLQYHGFDI